MLLYLRRLQNRNSVFKQIFESKNIKNRKIVVDYSSPNIAKQFHVGNLRSTLVGSFFCRINRLAGNQVVSINYLGDWGAQFGLLAAHWPESELRVKFNELPPEATLSARLELLQKAYVEAVQRAKQDRNFQRETAAVLLGEMEKALIDNDRQSPSLALWFAIRKLSLQYLEEFYNKLGISFDVYDAESEHVAAATKLVDRLITEGIVTHTADGLWVIRESGGHGYSVLRKSDGSTLYLSRELAATLHRDEVHQADEYVYVVDRAQSGHFHHLQHLLEVVKREDLAKRITHLGFGRVVGMSTRLGKCETVEQILVDGDHQAVKFLQKSPTMKISEEELPKVARELAETALFINDMKRNKAQEYTFNFKEIFKQKGMFAIQEKYSRLTSLIENNADLMIELERAKESESLWNQTKLDPEQNIRLLCQCLYELDASLFSCFSSSETAPLLAYLSRLASRIGPAMTTARVMDEQDRKLALGRLIAFVASRNVLEEGLELLGLKPLPRL
ncbi:unnamed protein product [Bursaphelenchus xylophilus]|uniref:Probable arginine--tRNA ligase, mitochondrial n=1 Tax=Bursaphelenchus xylophilus TaxID=6326 RepID=A0A1I7SWM2_BURXY|nr:unnamed protein product [Bursaphelenchus xylophilus]CAG9099660.1 unnamed protein product [Bursaphelenchus xylophilus]